jgi:hypothetical protein
MAARQTSVASWMGGTSLSEPPKLPMAERTALITKMSDGFMVVLLDQHRILLAWMPL